MRFNQYKKPELSDDEVLDIRKRVMSPQKVLKLDIESLISLNEHISNPTPAWITLFIDAVGDYVLDSRVSGLVISDEKARWLVEAVLQDGRMDVETEFNLLINLLGRANVVSEIFEAYMLDTVKDAILHGEGQWAKNRQLEPGKIGKDDVELLKRIFYAVGSEGGIDISRSEAEMIYDLNDATADADNHESWPELFSKMMACYMMAGISAFEPSEDWVRRRETWMKSKKGLDFSIGNILSGYKDLLSGTEKRDDNNPVVLNETLQNSLQKVTAEEAQWLIDRVNGNGRVTPNEAKMLFYIKKECPDMHSLLDEFITAMAYG